MRSRRFRKSLFGGSIGSKGGKKTKGYQHTAQTSTFKEVLRSEICLQHPGTPQGYVTSSLKDVERTGFVMTPLKKVQSASAPPFS